jgi:hypothetical protein
MSQENVETVEVPEPATTSTRPPCMSASALEECTADAARAECRRTNASDVLDAIYSRISAVPIR